MIDGKNACDQEFQEIAVMAKDHHSAGKGFQGFRENLSGRNVQVIGVFIQDQEIDRPDEKGGEYDPAFFASGKYIGAFVNAVSRKQKGGAEIFHDPDVGNGNGVLNGFKNGLSGIENVHGMLAEITDADIVAPMVTVPLDTGVSPARTFRSVDFPAPFTPTTAIFSPRRISRSRI